MRLSQWLQAQYPGSGSLGISRSCTDGGVSEHKEGRAFDWAVNVDSARDKRLRGDFFAKDFATDAEGNAGRAGPPDGHHVHDLERPDLLLLLRVQGAAVQGVQGAQHLRRHVAAPQPRAHLAEPGRWQRHDELVHRRHHGPHRPDGADHDAGARAGGRPRRCRWCRRPRRRARPAQAPVRHRHASPKGAVQAQRVQAARGAMPTRSPRAGLFGYGTPARSRTRPAAGRRRRGPGRRPGQRRGQSARLAEPARQRQARSAPRAARRRTSTRGP